MEKQTALAVPRFSFWAWLWGLVRKKPKIVVMPLPPPSVDFDEIFINEVREVQVKDKLRAAAVAKAEREREEAVMRRRNEGMPPEAFKKAIKKLAQLKDQFGRNILADHNCGLNNIDDWAVFREQFAEFLKKKGIDSSYDSTYPNYLWIESQTVKKYYEECDKKERPQLETITTGPYR